MQRAEDTRGLIVLIRSPNTLYIYIHTVYIYISILYIYILYIHTVPHLYIQPYDGMARSVQASNDDMEFTGSIRRSCRREHSFAGF